ncbi:MAG: transporter, partial [Candidatus Omnitrophota bacterium]
MKKITPLIFALMFSLCNAVWADDNGALVAEVDWSTDTPSTSQVEYTEDLAAGYTNSTPLDKNLVTYHRVVLKDLKYNTEYHYRVKSADAGGKESIGEDAVLVVRQAKDAAGPKISSVSVKNVVEIPQKTPELPKAEAIKHSEMAGATTAVQKPSTLRSKDKVANEIPIQEVLIEKGGLLLPPGKFQIEPDFTYAHTSSNKIVVNGLAILPILVIGEVNTQEISRDIFIPALTFRAGILDNLQGEFVIPYRYEFDRVSDSSNTETTHSASGLGDLQGGLSYQILHEQAILPGIIAGVSAKADNGEDPYTNNIGLGTGHWALRTNLVFVKSADPAMLFGNFGYTYTFARNFDNFGNVDPGDTFDYSL